MITRRWLLVLTLGLVVPLSSSAQEKSVRPGINKPFEDPDVKQFIGVFEGESREIYSQRKPIVEACKLKPGMVVADIGAGTGLFTRLFAKEIGAKGKVYAVDIAPKFIKHIEQTCKDAGLKNVTGVVCAADNVKLPAKSIDLAFICDTYHHFEFPFRTMASIHEALRPGGQVVVIDFHRIKGKSREWVMNHVRAGQEVVVKEIKSSGFKLVGEEKLPLKENYFIRFEKAGAAEADQATADRYDVLIRGGMVYDGSGKPPRRADVAIRKDRIAAVGDLARATAKSVVDAKDLAVAPGFINMLSWSTDSLLADGRGQSEVRQGVTTQIMGEGWSWGPVNAAIKKRMKAEQTDIKYDIEWTTLGEYLYFLQRKGISQNVASFLGATTVREYVLGLENKRPTADELERMCKLVELEMRAGALGIATALEYSPAYYADTPELIELCKVASRYKGKYISHMRSEGERLLEGIDEVIRISREAKIPAEIYHFKAAGKRNWKKMDAAIAKVEAARRDGWAITANMYCYTAGAAPLTACIPPWAMEGGEIAMRRRLRDPDSRKRVLDDIRNKTDWPNFYYNAGSPDNLLLVSFKQEVLKPLQGKTLAQIAKQRGKDPVETLLDLLVEDRSSIGTVYFITAEENIRKLVPLPWISFGSDEAAQAAEGVFLKSMPHPRAYGNFARLLGKYVREQKLLTLEAAIRKLTSLPATNLGLDHRGELRKGYYADMVVFDPKTIADRATYEKPHQYAVGVRHVFVNGVQVLKNGEHTGARPGRALWGPGKVDK